MSEVKDLGQLTNKATSGDKDNGVELTIDEYCNCLPSNLIERVRPKLLALQQRLEETRTNSLPCFVLLLRVKGCHLDLITLSEIEPSGFCLSQIKNMGYGTPEIGIATIGQISCLPAEIQPRRYRFLQGGRFLETDPIAHNCIPDGKEFIERVKQVFEQGNGTLWSLVNGDQINEIAQQNPELKKHILPMSNMLDKAKRGQLGLWFGDYVNQCESD